MRSTRSNVGVMLDEDPTFPSSTTAATRESAKDKQHNSVNPVPFFLAMPPSSDLVGSTGLLPVLGLSINSPVPLKLVVLFGLDSRGKRA